MVRKLCSGQEMLYKINQRGIIQKRNKVELRFLCIARLVIARSMQTKSFGVIWTYDDKVLLWTRKAGRRGHAADQSNTYMSLFQATQKQLIT